MAVVAIILGLFAYGGYRRQQRQVATLADKGMPSAAAPATVAGAEIAKAVPSGDLPTSAQRPSSTDPGVLQPPEDLDQRANDRNAIQTGSPVIVRQAASTPNVSPQTAAIHEPSAEERRLIAAYEREQQAILAPTTSQGQFGSSFSAQPQPANAIEALASAPTAWNARTSPAPIQADVRQQISRTADNEGLGDQNMQAMKEAFLSGQRAPQTEDYLKSTRTAPLSKYEIKAGWEIPAILEHALNSDLPGELKALVSSNERNRQFPPERDAERQGATACKAQRGSGPEAL